MNKKVIVNVASYRRLDSLVRSLKSIYNQCDLINVCLNDYDGDMPDFLLSPKINLVLTDNSKGDAFKFLFLSSSDGYFFTIDDDLIYPPNYVEYMIKKCQEYDNKKIITLHGRSFNKFPIESYYKSANKRFYFFDNQINDEVLQFGGTGVMCFHTDLLKVSIEEFLYPNMADVWIGKFAKERNIEIVGVKHDKNFIQQIKHKETIFDTQSKGDEIQTKIVNDTFTNKNKTELSIIMPTFNNVEFIDEALNSIVKSSKNHKIEILVGIDSCEKTLDHVKSNNYPDFISFHYFDTNIGPYIIKNTLSQISKSENLLFFDSDDVMVVNMIETIINELKNYTCIKPRYRDFGGKSLGGSKYGEGVFGIKKDIFLKMNGFEPWRVAADSDFMGRLYKTNTRLLHTPNVLFNRRVHPDSLTNRTDTGMRSQLRSNYAKISREKKGHGNPDKLNIRSYTIIDNSFKKPSYLENLENSQEKKNQLIITNVLNKLPKEIVTTEVKKDKIKNTTHNPLFDILKKNISVEEKDETTKRRNEVIEIKNKSRQEINREVFKVKPNRRKDLPNIRLK
jgi:glycosyltransferase involved in cell wall biosynthesis